MRRAGEFLGLVGQALNEVIEASPNGRVLREDQAVSTQRTQTGWLTLIRDIETGRERTIDSRNVVLATGASQPIERLRRERVAGVNLVERCGERLLQSGDVVSTAGFAAVAARLAGLGRPPRVAIIGGSTSAAAIAYAMLNRMPEVTFGPAGLSILHRRELRIFYPSVEAALAEGYTEFGPDDICPVSKRVFRLSGFRLDSRELIMRARGIGGRPAEPRLQLHRLGVDDAASLAVLDDADLVIAALGYRPRALPVFDQEGRAVTLHSETSPQARLVDNYCRVMDAGGNPLPQLFAIGLAAGFVPYGKLGGEEEFPGPGKWSVAVAERCRRDDCRRHFVSRPGGRLRTRTARACGFGTNPRCSGARGMNIPLVRPAPPQLSLAVAELKALEESGVFSNFGPVNTRFEQEMMARFFAGEGACVTVCNATIGLMLAIKDAVGEQPSGKFALMPSFTFAAAAHAALLVRTDPAPLRHRSCHLGGRSCG